MFKIQNKILVTFLSVVIVPLIIFSIFFVLYETKSLKQYKIDNFQQSTKSKMEEAIYFTRHKEKDIISLSNNLFFMNLIDAIARRDTMQINRWKFDVEILFKTFSESRGIYDQIRYIDESGREIVRVDLGSKNYGHIVPTEGLQDKSHRYYFKEAIKLNEGEVYVSALDLNREHGEIETPHRPMLRYAIPVFDRENQNRGILVLNVLVDFLLKNLARKHIKGVDSYLLDREGFYILHPEISKRWGGPINLNTGVNLRDKFPQETMSLVLSGQTGNKLVNKHYFNFMPIKFDPLNDERYWIFMEGLPASVVYSSVYAFYKMFGTLVTLLITGIIIATFVFSKKITKPINELVAGTSKISKGNLAFRIGTKTNDEIGYLANSFNDMTYKLGESRKQLQDYAENLEKKVEDKTKELSYKNKELEQIVYGNVSQ